MKKLLSLTLALLMVFSLATVALADTYTYSASDSPTAIANGDCFVFNFVYTLVGDGTSPAETFELKQVGSAVVDGEAETAPSLEAITISDCIEGAAATDGFTTNITVDLPAYSAPGVYLYTLEQTEGSTAGVTYDTDPVYLVVTVINEMDENDEPTGSYLCYVNLYSYCQGDGAGYVYSGKIDSINNTYTANTLSVTKNVTGNLGDTTKDFTFTITFENENDANWINNVKITGGELTHVMGNTYKFTLKDGYTVKFSNIPDGIKYTVTEDNYSSDGYKTYVNEVTTEEVREASGTFVDNTKAENDSVVFINDKTVEVATGITLDSVPFILILSVCAAAVVLFVIKRRNTVEF